MRGWMDSMVRCLATGVLVLLAASPLAAQSIAVRAWVDESTVASDDVLVYHVQIEGESFGAVQQPDPPETVGLTLAQPYPSTQRSHSLLNGVMRQSVQFSWRFRPLREGTARIASTTVQVGRTSHTTDPITVRVVSPSQRPAPRNTPAPSEPSGGGAIGRDDVFIEVAASKNAAFRNEQILVTYRLFFRPGFQFRQLRLADSWDAEGFWREEIEVDSNPIPESVVRNGERYASIVLKRVALFATRSGALTVDPLSVEADVYLPRRGRDPFDFFGMRGSLETARFASPPLRLRIAPLPDPAPADFRGAVGRFSMTADYDRTELEVGESSRLRVRISGSGNLSTLEPPVLDAPGAIEVYDPTTTASVNRTANGVSGNRQFEYVLVPRANGQFGLPPLSFSYFDPTAERYVTLRGDGVRLLVTGEPVDDAGVLPADGIAGIVRVPGRWHRLDRTPLHRQAWPYAAVALPLLVLGALATIRGRARRLEADTALARSRAAHPLARKHLRAASEHLERGEARRFYDALEHALLGFVGARMNVAEKGLTRAALADRLAQHGAPPDAIQRLLALLDRCDSVRFAPLVPDRPAQVADREDAATLIVHLDKHLPSAG